MAAVSMLDISWCNFVPMVLLCGRGSEVSMDRSRADCEASARTGIWRDDIAFAEACEDM
jgi:hypothetical protein